jgi:hypothetical protein
LVQLVSTKPTADPNVVRRPTVSEVQHHRKKDR